jgi:hypothetical protein
MYWVQAVGTISSISNSISQFRMITWIGSMAAVNNRSQLN